MSHLCLMLQAWPLFPIISCHFHDIVVLNSGTTNSQFSQISLLFYTKKTITNKQDLSKLWIKKTLENSYLIVPELVDRSGEQETL